MQIEALLAESLELLLLGMGSVFLLLGLMIILIHVTSWLLARWIPEDPLPETDHRGQASAGGDEDSAVLVAVIQATIHRYRSRT